MSLAAARNTGVISDADERVASAKSKKGFFSKLFGFSSDADDEDEEATPAPATRVAAVEPKEERAARVPVPQSRPTVNAKAGFALASASSTPVTLPARNVPRPPADVANASDNGAARETTSSITAWLNDAEFGRPDRVPPNMALAYAAQNVPENQRQAALAMPSAPAPRAAAPMAGSQAARIPPKAGQKYNDPWLRGITLATSVHDAMPITVYGKLDVRQVRMMMIKPLSSVPMTFGPDPYEGMQTLHFAGAAVTFLPTVTYFYQPERQASLR
jgi:hypothetical protein